MLIVYCLLVVVIARLRMMVRIQWLVVLRLLGGLVLVPVVVGLLGL